MRLLLLWLCCLTSLISCNVEKVIFTAPEAAALPADTSIDNLLLISLNPDHLNVRTHLNATFPTEDYSKGTESWLLVEGLHPGQRYEVRVCWLATQPTTFWLYTHSLSDAFGTPALISSLTSYSYARHATLNEIQMHALQARKPKTDAKLFTSSLLFLQVHAAADYFTLNKTLMENVPPVLVDIILDPYLFNVFPQSLVPTALYVSLIAVGAWYLSVFVVTQLRQLAKGQSKPVAPIGTIENQKDK